MSPISKHHNHRIDAQLPALDHNKFLLRYTRKQIHRDGPVIFLFIEVLQTVGRLTERDQQECTSVLKDSAWQWTGATFPWPWLYVHQDDDFIVLTHLDCKTTSRPYNYLDISVCILSITMSASLSQSNASTVPAKHH
jgi:hypothetical protein